MCVSPLLELAVWWRVCTYDNQHVRGKRGRVKKRKKGEREGETGTWRRKEGAFPSRDTSAMCADETGRCAKPGFDRHLSSYQHARRNCSDPASLSRPPPSRINARITSAGYHGLWFSISLRVVNYGQLPRSARETEIRNVHLPVGHFSGEADREI